LQEATSLISLIIKDNESSGAGKSKPILHRS
jgi:hypothetical protein